MHFIKLLFIKINFDECWSLNFHSPIFSAGDFNHCTDYRISFHILRVVQPFVIIVYSSFVSKFKWGFETYVVLRYITEDYAYIFLFKTDGRNTVDDMLSRITYRTLNIERHFFPEFSWSKKEHKSRQQTLQPRPLSPLFRNFVLLVFRQTKLHYINKFFMSVREPSLLSIKTVHCYRFSSFHKNFLCQSSKRLMSKEAPFNIIKIFYVDNNKL